MFDLEWEREALLDAMFCFSLVDEDQEKVNVCAFINELTPPTEWEELVSNLTDESSSDIF